jgi:hypothetical protein
MAETCMELPIPGLLLFKVIVYPFRKPSHFINIFLSTLAWCYLADNVVAKGLIEKLVIPFWLSL